jgi:hypothetical protein
MPVVVRSEPFREFDRFVQQMFGDSTRRLPPRSPALQLITPLDLKRPQCYHSGPSVADRSHMRACRSHDPFRHQFAAAACFALPPQIVQRRTR